MKRILLIVAALLVINPALMDKKRINPAPEENHINWLSMDDLQVSMKKKPKKVFMDVYTDWCGWCKRMEATTFSNPEVVKYMNENFYCVRFNAERKDTFRFMGKSYYPDPVKKANTLAIELTKDKLSYPTFIIMEEFYQNPQPIAGYLTAPQIEPILKYFAGNIYKNKQWPDFQKEFKTTWVAADDAQAPPAGH